ncbi:MAG: Na+/H+ antiporter NhaD/arsenite permease-like protein [Flavobacteriales bacterium]|jgi:Na+/H+ antiporter NhaD/arsenite permease-like protein
MNTEVPVYDMAMVISALILIATFIGLFMQRAHGIERAKYAMAGAGAIILAGQVMGFYSPQLALEAMNWNIAFYLVLMMVIVSIIHSSGGFETITTTLAKLSKGSQTKLIIYLAAAVALCSLMLDNLTTIIIFGPIIVIICQNMGLSIIPYLICSTLAAHIGGLATLVGDPPNFMIGSAAEIHFNDFTLHMLPIALCCWVLLILGIRIAFKRELSRRVEHRFCDEKNFKNKSLWYRGLAILAIIGVALSIHQSIGWQIWTVAAAGLTLLVFVLRHKELNKVHLQIETPLLLLLFSVFILIGGVEHSGLLNSLAQELESIVAYHPFIAALAVLWIAAVLSALVDNIALSAATIPILVTLEQHGIDVSLMWWSLVLGIGLGGNATHIGSSANIYIVGLSERLARENHSPHTVITAKIWLQNAGPITFATLVLCSLFITLKYFYG